MANKIISAILSLIIPGLGQIYGKQEPQKGVIFFIVFAIILIIYYITIYFSPTSFILTILDVIILIYCLYAAYDAYKYANTNNLIEEKKIKKLP